MQSLENYWPFYAVALVIVIRQYLRYRNTRLINSLKNQNPQYIDVRSPAEFAQRSNPNSINIPVQEIPNSLDKIATDRPVIFVCLSGTRSAIVTRMLKNKGITNVYNGGVWTNI